VTPCHSKLPHIWHTSSHVLDRRDLLSVFPKKSVAARIYGMYTTKKPCPSPMESCGAPDYNAACLYEDARATETYLFFSRNQQNDGRLIYCFVLPPQGRRKSQGATTITVARDTHRNAILMRRNSKTAPRWREFVPGLRPAVPPQKLHRGHITACMLPST